MKSWLNPGSGPGPKQIQQRPQQLMEEQQLLDLVSNGRNPVEVLIKTITLQLACYYSFGHLLSLQGQPLQVQSNQVWLSLLAPCFPIALLLRRALDTLNIASRRSREIPSISREVFDWKYYISAALGERASAIHGQIEMDLIPATGIAVLQDGTGRWRSRSGPGSSPTLRLSNFNNLVPAEGPVNQELNLPLLSIDPECELLVRSSAARDWRWAARLAWQFLFVIQCTAVIVGAVRRMTFSAANSSGSASSTIDGTGHADSSLDHFNTLTAIAGLSVELQSIAIILLNHKWRFHDTRTRERQPLVSDWQQTNTDTPRLLALAFWTETILSFRLFRNFYVPIWASTLNSHRNLTIFGSTLWLVTIVRAPFWARYPILRRKRWYWSAIPSDLPSDPLLSLLVSSEPCFVTLQCSRLMAIILAALSVKYISHCHKHYEHCECPLWMWKDPIMDKLYTL